MDELKRYSPLLGLICMLFFAGGVITVICFSDGTPQRQPIITIVNMNQFGYKIEKD